jgi:hypothetical protein
MSAFEQVFVIENDQKFEQEFYVEKKLSLTKSKAR